MGNLSGLTWFAVFSFGNLILSSAIVITAFSLLGYLLIHNLRSPVAQAFGVLLACVLVVYAGNIVVPRVENVHATLAWLRAEWLGIAMLPGAYVHFSDAVLRTTHHFSVRRRLAVAGSYALGIMLVPLALFTTLVVSGEEGEPPLVRLIPGPLFVFFLIFFVLTALYGAYNLYRARRRSLTRGSRRRMTYLTISFAAPGLGICPYLAGFGLTKWFSPAFVMFLTVGVSAAVGAMLVIMAYSVAYYGVLSPDRVVKHDLMHYLLRGPVVGILVIIVMLVMPRVELILGLPRDTALIFAVVGVIVIGQLAANLAKSWIERLIYSQDRGEIRWIQALEERLLTSSDMEQFLSNLLAGLCDLVRVDTGFVLAQTEAGFRLEAAVGAVEEARRVAQGAEIRDLWQRLANPDHGVGVVAGVDAAELAPGRAPRHRRNYPELAAEGRRDGKLSTEALNEPEAPRFCVEGGFWYCPLRSQDGEKMLGVLALRARSPTVDLDFKDGAEADAWLAQAAAALADHYIQEGVFEMLQRIMPDLQRIQEWRSALRFLSPVSTEETAPNEAGPQALDAQGTWEQGVKDALSHYWGGPKLTDNPLVGLRLVRRIVLEQEGSLSRAIRAVLHEAIEQQRPAGERRLTASEWLLYNILELRFVQGERVRDIAGRLAISESDLYRKQRVAIAAVAKTLAEMETQALAEEEKGSTSDGKDLVTPQNGARQEAVSQQVVD